MEQKPNIAVRVFGWIASFFIAIATLFKLMHWPGASPSMVVGSISFLLFYLPLWLINAPKKDKKLNLAYQTLILYLTSITFLFKTMHWPGAAILFNLWFILSICFVFPLSLYQLYKAGKKSILDFHYVVVFVLLGSSIIGSVSGSSARANSMATSFSKNTDHIIASVQRLKIKNKQLYSAFEQLENKNVNSYYLKAQHIKKITDSINDYIRVFRNNLISLTEDVSISKADSLSIADLRDKVNSGIPTEEICGYGSEPRKGKFSGMELKSLIETFRDSIILFVDAENRNFIKSGINLDTEPQIQDEDSGKLEDWVMVTFREIPITAVLLTLENIRYEIINAETQVLSDLLNSSSKNAGTNLASKIADLGVKLEDEKKQREIENLQKERELSQLRMQAKNNELEEQGKTITWFVAGLLGCAVMIFFIIRSNVIRKKINKELAEQKHLIEEKNKEILDSIHYAKRIQQALLPNEKYIERSLHQLNDKGKV